MLSNLRERDEALPSLPSYVFTEQDILTNLFIVQKNIEGSNASNCMVVQYFFQILFLREKIDNSISQHAISAIFLWWAYLIRTCMNK